MKNTSLAILLTLLLLLPGCHASNSKHVEEQAVSITQSADKIAAEANAGAAEAPAQAPRFNRIATEAKSIKKEAAKITKEEGKGTGSGWDSLLLWVGGLALLGVGLGVFAFLMGVKWGASAAIGSGSVLLTAIIAGQLVQWVVPITLGLIAIACAFVAYEWWKTGSLKAAVVRIKAEAEQVVEGGISGK